MKNQSPPTARENWKLGTWLCGRHETSLTCFHSILFFFYEMQGYFASRKLLLLLNLLRKLGNLSAKMATANIQGCQRYYFVILSSINKLKKKILGSRMAIMNFGLQGRKVDGGCVFPWACPDRPQNFLEKKKKGHDIRFLLSWMMSFRKLSEPYTTNLSGWFGTKSQD